MVRASNRFRPRQPRGFTLVEVLVAVVLVAVALTGVMGGIRALGAADAKARDADLLQRLAAQKLSEMGAVTDPRTTEDSGDFAEQGYPDIEWTMTIEPSGAENVDKIAVTASRGNEEQTLTALVYIRPVTGGGDAAAGGAGGATP